MVSSVLVTVPSDDWVTVFSFDLTVPSLLTLLLSVWETSRLHPIGRNDNTKADIADANDCYTIFHSCFSILHFDRLLIVTFPIGEKVSAPISQGPCLSRGFCFFGGKLRDGLELDYGGITPMLEEIGCDRLERWFSTICPFEP